VLYTDSLVLLNDNRAIAQNFQYNITKKVKKMHNLIFIITIAIAIIHTGCHHEHHQKHEPMKLKVIHPVQTDTTIFKEYVCQIRSIQHIELRALEKGYLEKILVDEGQFVKKGQLMFQILPTLYQAEVQKALAEVNYIEIEYQNTKRLVDSNIVSPSELALVKAKLEKAEAEYNLAKAHLGFTEIRAPFDGIVGRFKDVRIGSLLEEGELLTTLSDNSNLWVYFNVPEKEYLEYISQNVELKNRKVKLKMANQKLFDKEGFIETIEADFNTETGNIAFRANFENKNRILRNGETGLVLFPIQLKNAILIPQTAAFEVLDKKFVYILNEKNELKAQEIKVGAELPYVLVIEKGLNMNNKILVEGINKVRENDKIIPIESSYSEIVNQIQKISAE